MNNPHVLVVDDNAANIFVLATMLRQLGFTVDEATSGVEAINLVCHNSYALILMDHLMPEMDGVEAIRQIQFIMKGEECPVFIGVSATLDETVCATFETVGVTELLEKPVRMENLESKLESLGISAEASDSDEREVDVDVESVLSRIPGLDYEKGIELLAGSTENYMKVLSVCVKNIKDNYIALDSIRDTSQLDAFALHFHSLKGIFLNIGADEIAEKSRTLEMAAKERRLEEIREKISAYMEEVKNFDLKLEDACQIYNDRKADCSGGEEMSSSEFESQCRQLRQHIEDFEYIEITELLERMLSGCGNGDGKREMLEKVSECIQEFDYDGALELLEQFDN